MRLGAPFESLAHTDIIGLLSYTTEEFDELCFEFG